MLEIIFSPSVCFQQFATPRVQLASYCLYGCGPMWSPQEVSMVCKSYSKKLGYIKRDVVEKSLQYGNTFPATLLLGIPKYVLKVNSTHSQSQNTYTTI